MTTTIRRGKSTPASNAGSFRESPRGPARLDFADFPDGQLSDKDLLTLTRYHARLIANKYQGLNVDPEDIAQEIALTVLKGRTRQEPAVDTDTEPVSVWASEKAAIRTLTRNFAVRMITGHGNSADFQGARMFVERRDQMERDLGRALSGHETDDLAVQVWRSFPPGRRPREGFHRMAAKAQNVPLTVQNGDREFERVAPQLVVSDTYSDDLGFEPGSVGDEALELAETSGRAAKMKAKRLGYNAIAERLGAPQVREGTISFDAAAKLRRTIDDHGGPVAVATALRDGVDTPGSRALLRAFGAVSSSQAQQIGAALAAFPSYTDDLVDSAISAATRRKEA